MQAVPTETEALLTGGSLASGRSTDCEESWTTGHKPRETMGYSGSVGTVHADRAFELLYRAYYRQVFMYFKRRTDHENALDGTAETFLVAWRRRNDMPTGDSALPWLYGVARRVLANQRRGRDRFNRLTERVGWNARRAAASAEAQVVRDEHIQEVADAMDLLRPGDREVLRLAEWEGLSHAEIGLALGCSAHAVDQRVHRALKRLRANLPRRWEGTGHGRDSEVSDDQL